MNARNFLSFLIKGHHIIMPSTPRDAKLYEKVVKEAKKRFDVWPSAYASGWVVKTYKARGGRYTTPKPKSLKEGKSEDERALARWFKEQWVDTCAYIEDHVLVPCGRRSLSLSSSSYPYCRPTKRVSSKTPTTLFQITDDDEIVKRCRRKRRGGRSPPV
jgi:hypothetical protein